MSDDRECSDLLAILQETLDSKHATLALLFYAIKTYTQGIQSNAKTLWIIFYTIPET